MPTAPLHQCAAPGGCRKLTAARFCEDHQVGEPRHSWDANHRPVTRMRGRKLQRARARLFAREPLCRTCARAGRVQLATVRDHIVPLTEGGADDETNEQPLCQACSDAKTTEESKRGRARGRGV